MELFHLPGIEKINKLEFVFNEGIDADVALINEYTKHIMNAARPENRQELTDIERHLNRLEQVGSLFPEPVEENDEEKINYVNIQDTSIQIPDVVIQYHYQHQPEQNGFEQTENANNGEFEQYRGAFQGQNQGQQIERPGEKRLIKQDVSQIGALQVF